MGDDRIDGLPLRDANIQEGTATVARSTADWLSLAAAPVFAIMALLTAARGGPADVLCSAAHDGLPLNGMTLMYVLMSAFHSAPWLRLISYRRSGIRRLL